MALSTLLLPSSSSSSKSATVTDTSDRRRHHHHQNHTKRKKKLPPSLSPTPRTPPPGSGGHRAMAAVTASKKSSKQVVVAPKSSHHPKKSVPTTPSRAAPASSSSAAASVSSWEQLKSMLSCRSATSAARVHDPAAPSALSRLRSHGAGACGASLCAIRHVVDAASSVASSAAVSIDRDTTPLTRCSRRAHRAASSSSSTSAVGGHHPSLRGLSGCYECRAINVEPMSRRYPRPRELCACSQCGEVFTKAQSLEHHQAIHHAVSELGPEDSGRNIVEIIFKSSWQKRDRPICQIDRILKVHNAPRTVARFEAYRDAVRTRCRATAARAAADGNELLRFHSAGLACALGLNGATSLCADSPSSTPTPTADGTAACGVCAAIRHGFAPWVGAHPLGVRTTASSGRAHDCGGAATSAAQQGCRAMLVCRVIAGRVRRNDATAAEDGPFDSVAGDEAESSVYGNLEELFVANPRAILPCFVVIYRIAE